ncbi:MAG TPA: adenylate kinase family protein [Thermoplasmata archaeon]|nr:adenylate kinase family protein [Thermoplasmata archaeon]
MAVTGTPGTGKSSVCDVLAARGYHIVDLDAAAKELGLTEADEDGTVLVDVDALAQRLRVPTKIAFLKGHYAHRIPTNVIVVLRCHPTELWRRLEARGWALEKVRENVEAEAIDVVLQEAVARGPPVYEVDTTDKTAEAAAGEVVEILRGNVEGHEPGRIDWSEEVAWIGARRP